MSAVRPPSRMAAAAKLGLLATLALAPPPGAGAPLGTAFTYQGQLTESGQTPTGLYDLQVCLFDGPSTPLPLACAPDFDDVAVDAGLFALTLDFGAAPFIGELRFLELRVRPGASAGGYTILAPRQAIRPAPEALRAGAASAAPWSGLTGVPAGFADNVDNNSGGTVTSIAAGAGLSGGTITGSGTIGIANGGVGPAQIAAGAVGPGQIAAGAVGAAQIDTTQVQSRIAGACPVGQYFRGVNANGSVACESVPGLSTVTAVDGPVNNVGRYSSIAIGTDGAPVIGYYDATAFALKVAKCANAACTGSATITTVDDPANNVGQFTSIAIGTDGLPVVAYHDVTAGTLKVAKCANAACTGVATITTVDDPANNVGQGTSIAVPADGLPVISYADVTAGALKVAKCANPACTGSATITTVDPTGGGRTSIAIGSDGLPVISYGSVEVATCGNPACTASSINPLAPGSNSALTIDRNGFPVVAYIDLSVLRVAWCNPFANCSTAQFNAVDDPDTPTQGFPTIAIGADGLPVFAYLNVNNSTIKVARCSSRACSFGATYVAVDGLGIASNDNAMAIGADGLPVISYYDGPGRFLRVVKCGTRTCQ